MLGAFAASNIEDNLVFLGAENDVRHTGGLDDLVLADGGNDRIFAGCGNDTVLAGLGDDLVLGQAGRDILAGGAGRDWVHGGSGNDVVAGSDGDDFQTGGAGRDLMVDGLGYDLLRGGAGGDVFLYTEAALLGGSNSDDGGRFVGGSGYDTLYLATDASTRAAIEDDLHRGSAQSLEAIGVTTASIERYVFIDPEDPAAAIVTGARLGEADLWGIV